jgi:hypothetical protein
MTSLHPLPTSCQWSAWTASALDRRSARRLALPFLGGVLARGRRIITSWIRAADLSGQYQSASIDGSICSKRYPQSGRHVTTA